MFSLLFAQSCCNVMTLVDGVLKYCDRTGGKQQEVVLSSPNCLNNVTIGTRSMLKGMLGL